MELYRAARSFFLFFKTVAHLLIFFLGALAVFLWALAALSGLSWREKGGGNFFEKAHADVPSGGGGGGGFNFSSCALPCGGAGGCVGGSNVSCSLSGCGASAGCSCTCFG